MIVYFQSGPGLVWLAKVAAFLDFFSLKQVPLKSAKNTEKQKKYSAPYGSRFITFAISGRKQMAKEEIERTRMNQLFGQQVQTIGKNEPTSLGPGLTKLKKSCEEMNEQKNAKVKRIPKNKHK